MRFNYRTLKPLHYLICWPLALSLLALDSFAQSADGARQSEPETIPASDSKVSKPAEKKAEKMQVVGSRIKRIDAETATQIQTITKWDFESSGQTTIADAIRDIPVSTAGSTREESNRGAPGFSGINLRGIGEKYTLVLIDGKRLPPDPAHDAVDVGSIPAAMIERIEILKETASAIYGSDAVGGVVNIVTKKAFDGTSLLYSRAMPSEKGGIEDRLEAAYGKTYDQGSVVVTAGYRKRDSIFSKDRDFVGEGWSIYGSPGSFRPLVRNPTDPNAWVGKPGTTVQPDPRCPENDGISRRFANYCQYNFEAVATLSPEITDYSLMTKVEHQISDSLKIYGLARATFREALDIVAAAPGSPPITVDDPQAVANIKRALGGGGASIDDNGAVELFYRTVSLGNRETHTKDNSYFATMGLSGEFAESWSWGLDFSYGTVQRRDEGQKGFWLKKEFADAIKQSRFNPFDPNDSGSGLSDAKFTPKEEQSTQLRQWTAIVSGEVFELPGGAAQAAIGSSVLNEDFSSKADEEIIQNLVVGSSGSNGGGARQVPSFFAELSMPIVQDLEVNTAARYDNYHKYGGAFSPSLSLKYKLSDVLLRSSIGTGFRAPTLQEEATEAFSGFPAFIDNVKCNEARANREAPGGEENYQRFCKEQQYLYSRLPADDVRPEKALIYNLGLVWSPTTKSNLSFDWWTLQIKDRIGIPNLEQLTALEADGNASYRDKGIGIRRRDTGDIAEITAPATNLARTELSGIDVSGSLSFGAPSRATLDYAVDASYQIYNRESAFEGTPMVDQVDNARAPQYRVNNTIATRFLNDHRLAAVGKTIAGTKKVNPEFGDIPTYTTYDLHYIFEGLYNGSLAVGSMNLTNARPPKDESANPTINYQLYSYAGRSYYVRITQDF